MERDGLVAQFAHKISLPVPLMSRRVQPVKHALEGGMRNRPDEVERGRLEAANRFEDLLRFLGRSRVAPHDAAHLLEVQMLRERWSWWYGEKCEKSIERVRGFLDETAVPS